MLFLPAHFTTPIAIVAVRARARAVIRRLSLHTLRSLPRDLISLTRSVKLLITRLLFFLGELPFNNSKWIYALKKRFPTDSCVTAKGIAKPPRQLHDPAKRVRYTQNSHTRKLLMVFWRRAWGASSCDAVSDVCTWLWGKNSGDQLRQLLGLVPIGSRLPDDSSLGTPLGTKIESTRFNVVQVFGEKTCQDGSIKLGKLLIWKSTNMSWRRYKDIEETVWWYHRSFFGVTICRYGVVCGYMSRFGRRSFFYYCTIHWTSNSKLSADVSTEHTFISYIILTRHHHHQATVFGSYDLCRWLPKRHLA